MSDENNPTERRKTIAPILAAIGAGSVLASVVSLLGAKWPWLLLIFGVVLIVIAVFLSVPSTVNLLSPIRMYKQLRRTWIWWFRGPNWSYPKPIIKVDELTPNNPNLRRTNFTATLSLDIENRDDFPLEVAFYSLGVNIEQGFGRGKVRCQLHPNPSIQDTIQPHKHKLYELFLFGACSNDRCLDLKKTYNSGVQGILVGLNGVGYKDLHRGLYYKPIPYNRPNFL